MKAKPARVRILLATVLLGAFSASGLAQEAKIDPMIARIRDEGMNRSQVMQTLSYLTDVLGPRLTGSPNLKKANEWTRDKLTSWGMENAHLESWQFGGRGWEVKRFTFQVLEPQHMSMIAAPRPWSPGLAKALTDAPVIYLDAKTEADLEKYKGKLKGAVVLTSDVRPVPQKLTPQGYRLTPQDIERFETAPGRDLDTQMPVPPELRGPAPARGARGPAGLQRGRVLSFLMEEGAALELSPSNQDAGVLGGSFTSLPTAAGAAGGGRGGGGNAYAPNAPATIPQVLLAVEHYNRLVRVARLGLPIKADAQLEVQYSEDLNCYNTIAEIPGTDLKNEVVMVGGHLDSVIWGTGATDDGSGSAASMEVMRILKALDVKPRRTIRIGLWSGEELGLLGSRAYVRQHFGGGGRGELIRGGAASAPASQAAPNAEQQNFSVYFNLDEGGGKVRGIYVGNNPAAAEVFKKWLAPVADLGGATITLGHASSTDHVSFEGAGLAAFHFIQDPLDYWTRSIHTSQDLYDRVPPEDMKISAVIMATCIYQAAMADEKVPAPRQLNKREGVLQTTPPGNSGEPMKKNLRFVVPFLAALAACGSVFGQQATPASPITFNLTMDPPKQIYHVVMKVDGLKGETQDVKMPVWTPGYYGINDFAASVRDFKAADASGKELKFEKSGNAWKVQAGGISALTLTYDVSATRSFVGNSFLDASRAFLLGGTVLMYVGGQINRPVILDIKPNEAWKHIATGLDPVSADKPYVLKADDFDILYDSPILMGNLDELPAFEIQGIKHRFFGYSAGITTFDTNVFMNDLKVTIEQGIKVIGDIPYPHYTFIGIGAGGGGIEHLNSAAVGFRGSPNYNNQSGRNGTLRFLAHEYFHHFNVKRIRPIVLGPFDYDKANLTNMLWVSEGLTSYYADLMVARAGLASMQETLDVFRGNLNAYEGRTGRLFQSVAQASWNAWGQGSGVGGRGGGRGTPGGAPPVVKTISYYDKGPVLGMMLDFKIRHETKNQKSLDTVMQTLYNEYYKGKKRGWTDDEFREVVERIAGLKMPEFFEYIYTTKEIDYQKYFTLGGIQMEPFKDLAMADFRGVAEDKEGKLTITAMEDSSAAKKAGLMVNDVITALDGNQVTAITFPQAMGAKKPGDKVKFSISREGAARDIEFAADAKQEKTFKLTPIPNLDPLQTEIQKDWLRKR